MYENEIATLEQELDELNRQAKELEIKKGEVDRERSSVKQTLILFRYHRSDSQKIDNAENELEILTLHYSSLDRDYWSIINEMRSKNLELSDLKQRESIEIVARGGLRR